MQTAPFGQWDSPLEPAHVAAGKVSLSDLGTDGVALYWLESRPAEGGRVVLVRWDPDDRRMTDHSPPEVSIRSRVHEYGGGAVCLVPGGSGGAFAYVNGADQRVWVCEVPAGAPVALTPEPPAGESWNHGGLSASADGRWVLAVRECHRPGFPPIRSIVALGTGSSRPGASTIAEGHDFYGTPRLHPDGDRLVAVAWDHPDMQWDASLVLVVPLTTSGDGLLQPAGEPWVIAGGPEESVGQPAWHRDGSVVFASDRGGWWQPHRHTGRPETASTALTGEAAEYHGPDWVLSQTTMAELPDGRLVARRTAQGRDSLVLFPAGAPDPTTPPFPLAQPGVTISDVCAFGDGIACIGATPQAPSNIWLLPLPAASATERNATPLRPAPTTALDPADVARAEPFALTGRSGRAIYGSLYRPTLHATAGPADHRPPLIVWCHGGPTSGAQAGFDPTLQFFTTRGFAVATVDFAGSTGYGRAYRCSLWGLWGLADPEDCLETALQLAARGDVDPTRMAIRGGSSGGLTALNALRGEGFVACTSLYGVTDLLGLAGTTHDFEARYMDRLVGPLPESKATYAARSPVRHAADLHGAVLLLQGTEDAVVPPAQTEFLRDAMQAAGTHCETRLFEGEGHGFRRADTLIAALEAELDFYRRQLAL
jgi:dipeptidyl aminopeptidase/acylaminoacyl peptidase